MEEEHADPQPPPGGRIILASWVGTAALAAAEVLAVLWPDDAVAPLVALSLALAGGGIIVFLLAYARAIGRSRTDAIGIGGLYFLAGSAPRRVQVALLASLGAQVVLSLVGASLRPFTPVAFGLLVPLWGLGLAGLWGSTYGYFEPRGAPGRPADPGARVDRGGSTGEAPGGK